MADQIPLDQRQADSLDVVAGEAGNKGAADLTTSEGVVEQVMRAIARLARLVLLDLTGLSFCDARGLSAFVRIVDHADVAGAVSASSRRGRRPRRYCGSAAWADGCRCSPPSTTCGQPCTLPPAYRQPRRADRLEGAQQAHRADGCSVHHLAVCLDGPEGDRQAANTLTELVITGSLAPSRSRIRRVTAAPMRLPGQHAPLTPGFSFSWARWRRCAGIRWPARRGRALVSVHRLVQAVTADRYARGCVMRGGRPPPR